MVCWALLRLCEVYFACHPLGKNKDALTLSSLVSRPVLETNLKKKIWFAWIKAFFFFHMYNVFFLQSTWYVVMFARNTADIFYLSAVSCSILITMPCNIFHQHWAKLLKNLATRACEISGLSFLITSLSTFKTCHC